MVVMLNHRGSETLFGGDALAQNAINKHLHLLGIDAVSHDSLGIPDTICPVPSIPTTSYIDFTSRAVDKLRGNDFD